MTGQTLLPMPMGIESIFDEEWKAQQSGGDEVDVQLKSNIETIVTKWCSQIGDVLNEESTRAFANGKQPLPSAGSALFTLQNLEKFLVSGLIFRINFRKLNLFFDRHI